MYISSFVHELMYYHSFWHDDMYRVYEGMYTNIPGGQDSRWVRLIWKIKIYLYYVSQTHTIQWPYLEIGQSRSPEDSLVKMYDDVLVTVGCSRRRNLPVNLISLVQWQRHSSRARPRLGPDSGSGHAPSSDSESASCRCKAAAAEGYLCQPQQELEHQQIGV